MPPPEPFNGSGPLSLAVASVYLARQAFIKAMRKHHYRFHGLQDTNMVTKTAPGCLRDVPRGSKRLSKGLRKPTRRRREAC